MLQVVTFHLNVRPPILSFVLRLRHWINGKKELQSQIETKLSAIISLKT